jgi:hypothetical protein
MVVRAGYVVLVSLSFLSASAASCGGSVMHESVDGNGGSGAAEVDARSDGSNSAPSGCSVDNPCATGMKCCSAQCVAPAPIVGCSAHSCEPCEAPPANAVPVCDGETCAYQCVAGFVPLDGRCEPDGSGGTGGDGGGSGTGGAPPCDSTQCKPCPPAGVFGCCKADNTCGCTWAPGAICY